MSKDKKNNLKDQDILGIGPEALSRLNNAKKQTESKQEPDSKNFNHLKGISITGSIKAGSKDFNQLNPDKNQKQNEQKVDNSRFSHLEGMNLNSAIMLGSKDFDQLNLDKNQNNSSMENSVLSTNSAGINKKASNFERTEIDLNSSMMPGSRISNQLNQSKKQNNSNMENSVLSTNLSGTKRAEHDTKSPMDKFRESFQNLKKKTNLEAHTNKTSETQRVTRVDKKPTNKRETLQELKEGNYTPKRQDQYPDSRNVLATPAKDIVDPNPKKFSPIEKIFEKKDNKWVNKTKEDRNKSNNPGHKR